MTQLEIFAPTKQWEALELLDADVRVLQHFLDPQRADDAFTQLMAEIEWRQDSIRMYGRTSSLPRLHQWFGGGKAYTWSGIHMQSTPWCPTLLEIKGLVEREAGAQFNSVLANLYRTGEDMVSWHSDDEPELGSEPVIASVSLGERRDFLLRHVERPKDRVKILLEHGSLLVMKGPTQCHWQHSLPRRKKVSKPRVNLTFRWMEH